MPPPTNAGSNGQPIVTPENDNSATSSAPVDNTVEWPAANENEAADEPVSGDEVGHENDQAQEQESDSEPQPEVTSTTVDQPLAPEATSGMSLLPKNRTCHLLPTTTNQRRSSPPPAPTTHSRLLAPRRSNLTQPSSTWRRYHYARADRSNKVPVVAFDRSLLP